MAEEKEEKVTVDDVVEVLAKHSVSPSDPDDADTLTRFNQQVIDERDEKAEQESKSKETPTEASGVKPSTRQGRT